MKKKPKYKRTPKKPHLITGMKFSHLTIIRCLGLNIHGESIYECKCDCGKICNAVRSKITSFERRSCGCLTAQRLQRDKPDPTSRTWQYKDSYDKFITTIWSRYQKKCFK